MTEIRQRAPLDETHGSRTPSTASSASSTSDVEEEEHTKKQHWWHFGKTTRQLSKKEKREKEVQKTIRELIIYALYIICLLIVAYGRIDPTMFGFTKVMSDVFLTSKFIASGKSVTFKTSSKLLDFWQYADTVLVEGLYWDHWYKRSDPVAETQEDDKKILYENLLIGVPRIRQVRVRNQSCVVHDEFTRSFTYCYDVYSPKNEDKEPFGGPDVEGTAWSYSNEKDINGTSLTVYGDRTTTYGGGGYYTDLASTYEESVTIIHDLRKNLWIDRGTRAVIVDFTVYNANVNLFCVVKLVVEVTPAGGVITSSKFRAQKLLPLHHKMDFVVLGVEFVFASFILFFTFEELREIFNLKWQYFKSFWNWLEMAILGIAYTGLVFTSIRMMKMKAKMEEWSWDQTYHQSFTSPGDWQQIRNDVAAIVIFLSWLKIFKYIGLNKTLIQLRTAITRCFSDVLGFSVMFFIVFSAFAMLGNLLFGTKVAAFGSFRKSVFSLLLTLLGTFDYEAIEQANRFLGPTFFLAYVFFIYFVLLNMFLAIINDTYSEVKSEISKEDVFLARHLLARGYHNILKKLGCKRKPKGKDGESLSQDEIRAALRKNKFPDYEIEMFFTKCGIDKTKMLSKEEVMKMLRDLEAKERAGDPVRAAPPPASEAVPQEASQQEFQALESRVQQIESHLDEIGYKVDLILNVLAARKTAGKKF